MHDKTRLPARTPVEASDVTRHWTEQINEIIALRRAIPSRVMHLVLLLLTLLGAAVSILSLARYALGIGEVRHPWVSIVLVVVIGGFLLRNRKRPDITEPELLLITSVLGIGLTIGLYMNGGIAALHVPGLILFAHVVLQRRTAMVIGIIILCISIGILGLVHTEQANHDLAIRLLIGGSGLMLFMQTIKKHWESVDSRFAQLGQQMAEEIALAGQALRQSEIRRYLMETTDQQTGLLNQDGFLEAAQAEMLKQAQHATGHADDEPVEIIIATLKLSDWSDEFDDPPVGAEINFLERLVLIFRAHLDTHTLIGRTDKTRFCFMLRAPATRGVDALADLKGLQDHLSRPLTLQATPIHLNPRIGYSVCGKDGDEITTLWRHALLASRMAGTLGIDSPLRYEPLLQDFSQQHRDTGA